MKRKYRTIRNYNMNLAQVTLKNQKKAKSIAIVYGEIIQSMIFIVLNEEFGFGAKRLEKLKKAYGAILKKSANDGNRIAEMIKKPLTV